MKIAETKDDLDKVFQVRYVVFGEQGGYINLSRYPGGRESDSFDTLSTTTNFLALDGENPVATVRMLERNQEVAERNGWDIGLDMEHLFDMSCYVRDGYNPVELPRSSVLKEYEKTGVIMSLWALAVQYAKKKGVTHICAVGNTETDHPIDSRIFHHSVMQNNLVHPNIHTPPRKVIENDSEPLVRLYSDDDIRSLGDLKDLDKVDLSEFKEPRVLHIFTKIGARYTGEPTFYPEFDRYTIPITLTLDKLHPNHPLNQEIDFDFEPYL